MGRYGAMSQEIKPFIPGFHMVVIPKDDAKTILEKALGILKKEVEIRKRMVSGEALFDILGLGKFFEENHPFIKLSKGFKRV